MDRALGIDIYNGNSDEYNMPAAYRELRASSTGEPFLIHKASQGWDGGPGGWIDWKLQGGISRGRSAGFKRVAGYHWLLHGQPEAQADLFARALDLVGGRHKVGALVDFERNDWNQALNPQADDLYRFFDRFRAIGGNPLVAPYSAAWYTDSYPNARLDAKRVGTGVWAAQYSQRPTSVPIEQAILDVTPGWMAPFDGWGPPPLIRQWCSNGLVAGIPSDCDVTYLPSSIVDALFGITTAPPKPVHIDPHGANRYLYYPALSLDGPHNTDANSGGKVHVWQMSLNMIPQMAHFKLAVDGVYGPSTRKVTVAYQQLMKLADDGVVGMQSWATMGASLTFLKRWIYDGKKNLSMAAPSDPRRVALPVTHSLNPAFHELQGELFRDPARLKVEAG